jgi:phage terminase large subunit-like protein
MDDMTLFVRCVPTETNAERIIAAAKSAVRAVCERLSIDFDEAPVRWEGETEEHTWFADTPFECVMFLSIDHKNGIARFEISTSSPEASQELREAFCRCVGCTTLEEQLRVLRTSQNLGELDLVRAGLLAEGQGENEQLAEEVARAFKALDPGLRRAATYTTFLLRWTGLLTLLTEAVSMEEDAELKELMEETLRALRESPPRPRIRQL